MSLKTLFVLVKKIALGLLFLFTINPSAANEVATYTKDKIKAALIDNPDGAQSALISFHQGMTTKQLASWVKDSHIQVLDAMGVVMGSQRRYQVFAKHLFAFEGSLEQRLNRYVAENLNDTIDNITQRLKHRQPQNKQLKIDDLNDARGSIVIWKNVTVVASNKVLITLMNDLSLLDLVLSQDSRTAWVQSNNRQKLPLSLLKRPKPGSSEALRLDSKRIKQIRAVTASNTISCGPGESENNCPPDTHWLPRLGAWYTRIQLGNNNVLYGWQYTPVSWNSTQIKAFKDHALAQCDPYIVGADAQCGFPGFKQSNVIYVPDSTFEIEAEIVNPSCLNRGSNAQSNFENACFEYFWAFSNFPTAYIDTPLFDEPFVWNSTIGTVHAQNLKVYTDYYVYYHFAAQNEFLAFLTYTPVKIRGQIGSKFDPCLFGYPLCVFGIDTTKLAEAILIPAY